MIKIKKITDEQNPFQQLKLNELMNVFFVKMIDFDEDYELDMDYNNYHNQMIEDV